MKNTVIILCCVFALQALSAKAQQVKGNSFILGTFTTNMGCQHNNLLSNYLSRQNGSYMYVNSKNPTSAMRYGIGIGERYNHVLSSSYVRNDTTFQLNSYTSSVVPRIIIGKEKQKYIHSDVMFVFGADFSLGGGSSRNEVLNQTEFENGNITQYNTSARNGFSLYGSCTPFSGIRVSWDRITFGYTASIPIEMDGFFQSNNSNLSVNTNFAHNLTAGYRIFNSKK